MGFVTQAGVAIGLCKQTALEFPTWGKAVNALCVCCILVNLLFGPIAFRWVLQKVGEANADANFLQTGPGVPQWNTPVFTPKHPTAEIKVVELREAVSHAS
ncbi:hypothetical protein DIPPA_14772 [Diplonema papillatum]|nr:hypothetical protein DIPPA_14772 [Diplonema papillatum]